MGSGISNIKKLFSKKTEKKGESTTQNHPSGGKEGKLKEFSDDIDDAANLAIAMEVRNDVTTNVLLSMACEDLPKMDAFS
jgi:hypothetical protein